MLALAVWLVPSRSARSVASSPGKELIEVDVEGEGEGEVDVDVEPVDSAHVDRVEITETETTEPGGGTPAAAGTRGPARAEPGHRGGDSPADSRESKSDDTSPSAPGVAAEGAVTGGGGQLGAGLVGAGVGSGGGIGRGHGAGAGDGSGAAQPPPKPARRAAKRSKARPARLIYPKRLRKVIPEELFIAVITVDSDGYVDGVRLKKGVDPHSDEKALGSVWRFRYDPARDDHGEPIRSRVVQQFMID